MWNTSTKATNMLSLCIQIYRSASPRSMTVTQCHSCDSGIAEEHPEHLTSLPDGESSMLADSGETTCIWHNCCQPSWGFWPNVHAHLWSEYWSEVHTVVTYKLCIQYCVSLLYLTAQFTFLVVLIVVVHRGFSDELVANVSQFSLLPKYEWWLLQPVFFLRKHRVGSHMTS